jgi:hypothetical protein
VTKLKLRRSIEIIRSSIKVSKKSQIKSVKKGTTADTRMSERGMVCETHSKERLRVIMKNLGINVSGKTREQCSVILAKLIELEISERQSKTKTKYLYGWWDNSVHIISNI